MELNNKKITITLEESKMKIDYLDFGSKEQVKPKTFLLLYKDIDVKKVFGQTIADTLIEMEQTLKKI